MNELQVNIYFYTYKGNIAITKNSRYTEVTFKCEKMKMLKQLVAQTDNINIKKKLVSMQAKIYMIKV